MQLLRLTVCMFIMSIILASFTDRIHSQEDTSKITSEIEMQLGELFKELQGSLGGILPHSLSGKLGRISEQDTSQKFEDLFKTYTNNDSETQQFEKNVSRAHDNPKDVKEAANDESGIQA